MRYARARSLVDSTANAAIDLAFPFTIEQTALLFASFRCLLDFFSFVAT